MEYTNSAYTDEGISSVVYVLFRGNLIKTRSSRVWLDGV